MSEHLCEGPDGANLLGYLCAVGALATLERCWPERSPKLAWRWVRGWRPVLHVKDGATPEAIVSALAEALKGGADAPELDLGDDVMVPQRKFRDVLTKAVAATKTADRRWVDFLAALGADDGTDDEKEQIGTTALRAVGAGQQRFLGSVKRLVAETTAPHLAAALFAPWAYADPDPSMRWDPLDNRQYALRGDDPGKAAIKTVRGANRLGIEALPCFPTAPLARKLGTAGFDPDPRRRDWVFHWALHQAALSLDGVRTLAVNADLLAAGSSAEARGRLRARGVAEVFAARRVSNGRYRNFESAEPLL